MRLRAAVAFALLAMPAPAADSLADQAHDAFATFAGGKSQADFMVAGVGSATFKGVAGAWVGLNGPAPGSGIESYGADAEKSCKSAGVLTLDSPNPLTMTLSAKPLASQFTQTYTLIGGSTFSQYTEPAPYLEAIGLGADKVGPEFDQNRALALTLANGIVQIYRPSEDILVITRDRGYPSVLARCPKS